MLFQASTIQPVKRPFEVELWIGVGFTVVANTAILSGGAASWRQEAGV